MEKRHIINTNIQCDIHKLINYIHEYYYFVIMFHMTCIPAFAPNTYRHGSAA